ncbi:MAG: YkvI family membrane protein [Cellulosilyticaceae bacterium]
MKNKILSLQLATIFVGSIVGAGLSSGRELNQFFSVYGYKSFIGLILCGLAYILIGKMIIEISAKYKVKSYDELVMLVCPKWVGIFTNGILTLFLLSSTSIILAGSCAVIHQYFGVPKWVGFLVMVGCSSLFLLRNTEGLFEVNSVIVPLLVAIMTVIFIGFVRNEPQTLSSTYLQALGARKNNWMTSSMIYSGFNIISIIGVLVPLTYEIGDTKVINQGVKIGTIILTIISSFIVFLMMVNPSYPSTYEIPILAVAKSIGKVVQVALLIVIWLEMFSSQISNIYSLSKCAENRIGMSYRKSIFVILLIAAPFSMIGFSKLVDFLYPIYGVLSMMFMLSIIIFYYQSKITICKKSKQHARS